MGIRHRRTCIMIYHVGLLWSECGSGGVDDHPTKGKLAGLDDTFQFEEASLSDHLYFAVAKNSAGMTLFDGVADLYEEVQVDMCIVAAGKRNGLLLSRIELETLFDDSTSARDAS